MCTHLFLVGNMLFFSQQLQRSKKWFPLEVGNYSINRENHDNLASNNCIVTIFLVFNY